MEVKGGEPSTICLPKECHKGAHSGYALFMGWGNTKFGEKNSEQLRYTTAEMIDNKECAKTYTGGKEIADHMICAIGLRDFCEVSVFHDKPIITNFIFITPFFISLLY